MMKKFFYFAVALLGMASCTSEDFAGDQSLKEANENAAISFAFDVPMTTRAEGAAAATMLNNQFIVWGEKNEVQEESGAPAEGTEPAAGDLVINNYIVNYVDNSAYTTTSNTKDWEYVGFMFDDSETTDIKTTNYSTNVTPNSGSEILQTIKYWDYAATSYTYTAISAKPGDITNGRVKVNKLTSVTTVYDKGYEVTLAKDANDNYPSLADLYFADRAYIEKTATYDRTASNQYGGNVQFTFRNTQSQVRVGVYETIPGYKVSAIHFFKQDGTTEYNDGASTPTSAFGAVCPNISATNYTGTLTVTYGNGTNAPLNQPIVSVSRTSATDDLILGTNYSTLTTTKNSEKYLGESATTATYDTDDGTYTFVMPQKNITSNLKLKVNYTLYNEITKETITITGKTAEVPAQYLNWKPNFKYTYLFKITDNDLYPITFDAAVIEAENGEVEYITTVSEPCITTYARGSAVTTNNDYKNGELIYAVVEDGSSLATLSATNMKLYTVTTTDATNFPITEASVAEAIAEYPIMTAAEQTNAKIQFTPATFTFGKTVVAEDGTTVTMDADNNVVASFTGAAIAADATAGTDAAPQYYAIEYIKTAATYGYDNGNTYADADAFAAAGTLYTRTGSEGSYTYTVATSWTDATTTYYKKSHVTNVGVYAYKIVKVVP